VPDNPETPSVESVKRELQGLRRGMSLAHRAVVLRMSRELRAHILEVQPGDVSGGADEIIRIAAALRSAIDSADLFDRLHLSVEFNLSADHSSPTLTERQESLASQLHCTSKTVRRHANRALDDLALAIVTKTRLSDRVLPRIPPASLHLDAVVTDRRRPMSVTSHETRGDHERAALVFGAAVYDLSWHLKDMPASDTSVQAYAFEERPGGKGLNQAVGLARLGGRVRLLCPIGEDNVASTILDYLQAERVETGYIEIRPRSKTPRTLVLAFNNGSYVHVGWKNEYEIHLSAAFLGSATVRQAIESASVILLTLEPPRDSIQKVFGLLSDSKRCPVILTASPPIHGAPLSGSDLGSIDFLIATEWELRHLLDDTEGDKEPSVDSIIHRLLLDGVGVICVLYGNRCHIYGMADDFIQPSQANVILTDSSASEDAFAAALAARLAAGSTGVEQDFYFAYYAMLAAGRRLGTSSSLPTEGEIAALQERISGRG
jgi:sugar/nucleoside kinase (ribokinase family)